MHRAETESAAAPVFVFVKITATSRCEVMSPRLFKLVQAARFPSLQFPFLKNKYYHCGTIVVVSVCCGPRWLQLL